MSSTQPPPTGPGNYQMPDGDIEIEWDSNPDNPKGYSVSGGILRSDTSGRTYQWNFETGGYVETQPNGATRVFYFTGPPDYGVWSVVYNADGTVRGSSTGRWSPA